MKNAHALDEKIALFAQHADACERSWSIGSNGVEDRVLFFFAAAFGREEMLAEVARDLGIPQTLVEAWLSALPGADAIGLALRTDGASVRLYTQYWDAQIARLQNGNFDPLPLYAGFKKLQDGSTRVDAYVCLPMAPEEIFMPPLADMARSLGLKKNELDRALAPLTAETCIFTTTEREGRSSWLATVRRAGLDRGKVAKLLAPLAKNPQTAPIAEAAETRDLIHIAGGTDALKGTFTTFYFDIEADEAVAAVTGDPTRQHHS